MIFDSDDKIEKLGEEILEKQREINQLFAELNELDETAVEEILEIIREEHI